MRDNSTLRDKFNPPVLDLPDELTDQEVFDRAMAEVKPLSFSRTHAHPGRVRRSSRPHPRRDFEALMAESRSDEWFFYPGYIEGGPELKNPLLLERLRRGHYSVQAELDLHGFVQKEAYQEVEAFIQECRRRRLTCVRIIHGKGKNSPNRIPILKNEIQRWLSLRRLSRHIVAYTSARPVDGGSGAIYLLLRAR